jgi:class 3 adenylate cyclase/tetratricopeptide (TPR) repeat protein
VTGERKPVSALFADIVGSTALAESMDPEDWAVLLNEAFAHLGRAVSAYGGTVVQLHGDGLLALFGAPVAHENDPERAVRAGLEMIDAVERFAADVDRDDGVDFRIRVGVNTGPVVVAEVGNALRYDYTAFGDTMNVAARLQASARPNTVRIAEATRRLVGDQLRAADLGELELKGKSEPVRAYEAVSLPPVTTGRAVAGLESPMIGRAADLASLEGALAAARAGRGGVAVVVGEPGVGKSRLLAELRGRAAAAGVRWVDALCPAHGRTQPYGLIVDVLGAIVGDPQEAFPDDAAFLADLLGAGADDPGGALVARLEPHARRTGYLRAARRALADAAEDAPLVVACEDVHWADESSVDMLAELLPLARETALLLVCTSRPYRDAPGWQLVTAAREVLGHSLHEVELAPLGEGETDELLGRLLAAGSLPEDVRRLVRERTEGNPLFVEETVRMLVERGVITEREGRLEATGELPAELIPDTLHGLLLSRIDRLAAGPRTALRVASVIGRTFEASLLEALVPPDLDLPAALDALEASGLARRERAGADVAYAFHHVLVQEAAYGSLLRRERRALHAAVADAMERRGDAAGERAGVVALHLEAAGETDRALPLLADAGWRAAERFANREAWELLGRAESYLPAEPDDVETRRLRAWIVLGRIRAGRTFTPLSDVMARLVDVMRDVEAVGDPHLEGEVLLSLARALRMQGEHPRRNPVLGSTLERLRALGDELGDDRFRGLPLAIDAGSRLDIADYPAAIERFDIAVPMLERSGSLADASYYAGLRAVSYGRLGDFDAAERALDVSDRLAGRSGDPNAILDADLWRSMVEGERGNLREAIALGRRGIELADSIGNRLCALVGSNAVGQQQLRMGAPAEAIPTLERTSELAAYCNAGPYAVLARAWLAAARARLGDLDDALPQIEASLADVRALGDAYGTGEILRERATVRTLLPGCDWPAAAADFQEAIATFERLGTRPALARALQDFAMALEARGEHEAAEPLNTRATALLAGMGLLDTTPAA